MNSQLETIQKTLQETKHILLQSTIKLAERGHTADYLDASAAELQATSQAFVITVLPWHRRGWELLKQHAHCWTNYLPFYYCCIKHD